MTWACQRRELTSSHSNGVKRRRQKETQFVVRSTGTDNRLTSDGTYNYTYDNEGNTLTKTRISDGQRTEYTWDYRNRLTDVKVKTAAGTVTLEDQFTYDIEDRRINK